MSQTIPSVNLTVIQASRVKEIYIRSNQAKLVQEIYYRSFISTVKEILPGSQLAHKDINFYIQKLE